MVDDTCPCTELFARVTEEVCWCVLAYVVGSFHGKRFVNHVCVSNENFVRLWVLISQRDVPLDSRGGADLHACGRLVLQWLFSKDWPKAHVL